MQPISKGECDLLNGIYLTFLKEAGGDDVINSESNLCKNLNLDCKLIGQLDQIDTAISKDGCITEAEVAKKYPTLERPDITFSALQVRAIKLAGKIFDIAEAETKLALQPALTQRLVSESGSPIHTTTTRIDMVEELMGMIARGYLVRDLYRSQGGIKAFWDVASFPRKLAFWQDSNSMIDLWAEWAEGQYQHRKSAVYTFIKQLRSKENVTANTVDNILYALKDESPASNQCDGWFGGMFFDCPNDILQNDYPLAQIEQLLRLPDGETGQLADHLMALAAWLEGQNNWVAAQYIYEQIHDNHLIVGQSRSEEAKKRVLKIAGNPENRSAFMAAILPPMPWHWNDLSQAEQSTMVEDWIGFGIGFFAGSKAISTLLRSGSAAGSRLWAHALSRSPRLQNFVNATANAAGKAGAGAEAAAPQLGRLGRGAAWTLGGTGKILHGSWYYSFGALGRGIKNAAPYVVAITKPTVDAVRSTALNPKSFFQPPAWLVTKGFQGTGWLLVNATQGIGLNWKPAVMTWWGFMAYGDPFISGIPQAEDDLGLPVLKGGLCEYELDWAIQEVHDEIREKGISFDEQIIIKKLDREIWLRGRRENKRSNLNCAGRTEQKNSASHFDEAKWEFIFNPLLKEVGLVYMDQESTYEVDRETILSAPRSEPSSSPRNLIANQKREVRREIPGSHPFPAIGNYEPASAIAFDEDLLCDTLGIDCHENHLPKMTRYSLVDHMEATLNTYVFEKDGEHYLIFIPQGLEKGLGKFIG